MLRAIRELLGRSHRERHPLVNTPSEIEEYERNQSINTIIYSLEASEYRGSPLDKEIQKNIDIQIRSIFASYL
jgi:hypothetical protein